MTEFVLSYALGLFNWVGLDPQNRGWFANIRAALFIFSYTLIYVLNILGIFVTYDGVESLAESIDAFPSEHQVLVKISFSVLWMRKYVSLMRKIKSMWPDDVLGEDLRYAIAEERQRFKTMFLVYQNTIVITAVIYVCKPLISRTRTLPTAWYVPCQMQASWCYIPVLATQCVYIQVLAMVIICYDALFFGLLFKAYMELEKIKYGFRNLEIDENYVGEEPETGNRFATIVQYHNYILGFINDINGLFYLQLLNHFLTLIFTICFGIFFLNIEGFPPSLDKVIKYVPYLISYHFQAYIYCVSGELLNTQVLSVSDAVFDSKWHVKNQPNLTKGMCLVIQMSRMAKKLTIGGLWNLNLATFGGVIKASVSFNTLMQTIYKTE